VQGHIRLQTGAAKLQNILFKSHGKYIYFFKCLKVKVKVNLEQATKAQKGSRGIDLLFL